MTTRDRNATEARLLDAVGVVLARDGFDGLGVNTIAREAGVDKVLIYRYFGGLAELLQVYGERGAFWPSVDDILGDDRDAVLSLAPPARYAEFFRRFVAALRARPLTIAILSFEAVSTNELTAVLDESRERWGEDVARALGAGAGGDLADDEARLRPLTVLLIAGIQYLLVRAKKTAVFGGISVQSDEGWQQFTDAIAAMASAMLAPSSAPSASASSSD